MFLRGQGGRTAERLAWVIFIYKFGCLQQVRLFGGPRAFVQVWSSSWGECCKTMYPCFFVGKGQNCRTSGCLQQILCQWPSRAFSASVVSFLGPVLYVSVTEIVERYPWASFWQGDRSVERLAWVIVMNWVVCSRSSFSGGPRPFLQAWSGSRGQCCIRVSSWARAQICRTSVWGDITDIIYLVVYSRSGSSAAPGLFCKRGQLLGAIML